MRLRDGGVFYTKKQKLEPYADDIFYQYQVICPSDKNPNISIRLVISNAPTKNGVPFHVITVVKSFDLEHTWATTENKMVLNKKKPCDVILNLTPEFLEASIKGLNETEPTDAIVILFDYIYSSYQRVPTEHEIRQKELQAKEKYLLTCGNAASMLYGDLFKTSQHADVVFRFEGQEDVSAHKLILQINSPTLESMLSSNFKEGITGEVVISPTVKRSTLCRFLECIYTGRMIDTKELKLGAMIALFNAFDYYLVDSRASDCLLLLSKRVTKKDIDKFIKLMQAVNSRPAISDALEVLEKKIKSVQ